jgi:phosphoribosylaminoimidazole-succinocarboxamide synthase
MSDMPETLFRSELNSLECLGRGKVRDIYAIDADRLLIVTTDRLSAFDVVLPDPIPGKGAVLNALSRFWFQRMARLVDHQMLTTPLEEVLPDAAERQQVAGRAMIVRRLEPLPVEAIVRGYLIGSGWRDYESTGAVCGIELPAGLRQAEALPEPVFTPSTKAAIGEHDENVSYQAIVDRIGRREAQAIRRISLEIYERATAYARERGIILADTKFEFGLAPDGSLVWIDEAITPDSSRFWPASDHQPGQTPPSFDKQFVRDYLETLDWDKTEPAPRLPEAIIQQTAAKYREAEQRLLGVPVG